MPARLQHAENPTPGYRMLRVREEDFERLKEAAELLRKKGFDSVDWSAIEGQDFVAPPKSDRGAGSPAAAFTWGFFVGLGAAAIAALVAQKLKDGEDE